MDALFLGLGSIGQRHLRLWRATTSGRILALRSRLGREVDKHLYEPVSSIPEAARAGARVAFICNPTALHIGSALDCAACGMDVFIEKPIGSSRDRWNELRSLVTEKQRIAYVAYQFRFHPLLCRVRELVISRHLGTLYSAAAYCGSYLPAWHPDRDYRLSYSARPELGGGVVLDLSHELDYLTWLFGPIRTLYGKVAKISSLEIQTDDHADLLAEFEEGLLAQIHLDYYRQPPRRDLELVGELGVLRVDLINGRLQTFTTKGSLKETVQASSDEPYRVQLEYFLQCVRERRQPMNNLEEAGRLWFQILALMDARE